MNLRDIQKSISREILDAQESGVQSLIHAGDFDSSRRIQIYRNNIQHTLTESLQSVFPVTEAMVGEDFFKHLARRYVAQHPPEEGNIHSFGEQLPDFIKTVEEASNLGYLPDIARIDWACHMAFHAQSVPAASIDNLAEFPSAVYEQLVFRPHPSCTFLSSEYPIFDIWNYAMNQQENDVPDINAPGQCVLIVRNELEVNVFNIEKELFILLDMSGKNNSLGSILPYIIPTDTNYDLQTGLQKLFSIGAVAAISA